MAAIFPFFRHKSSPPFFHHKSSPPFFHLLRLRYFSTASPAPRFLVKYLTKSCGLSAAEAAKASRPIADLQSTEKPDAVINFLRSQGLGASHIRRLITKVPRVLVFDVKRTLAPRLESLRSMGFSEPDLVDILAAQPNIIASNVSCSVLPKLKMWEFIFGSRELLVKHLKWKCRILSSSNEKVASNITFLREECGIPRERIYLVLRLNPSFILLRTDLLRALVARTKELGVSRKSKMFIWILNILGIISKTNYEAKHKLMKATGWSDSQFISAIMKAPHFLGMSQEGLRRKLDFFLNKVGCSPSYIAERPKLLMHSLEKRLIPRFHVMEMLKSEGLWKQQPFYFFALSDKKYREFVLRHKDKVPKLLDIL